MSFLSIDPQFKGTETNCIPSLTFCPTLHSRTQLFSSTDFGEISFLFSNLQTLFINSRQKVESSLISDTISSDDGNEQETLLLKTGVTIAVS